MARRSKRSEAERKTKKEMDGWGGKSFRCAWYVSRAGKREWKR